MSNYKDIVSSLRDMDNDIAGLRKARPRARGSSRHRPGNRRDGQGPPAASPGVRDFFSRSFRQRAMTSISFFRLVAPTRWSRSLTVSMSVSAMPSAAAACGLAPAARLPGDVVEGTFVTACLAFQADRKPSYKPECDPGIVIFSPGRWPPQTAWFPGPCGRRSPARASSSSARHTESAVWPSPPWGPRP
jgi:hypothetical protein